MNSRFVSKRNPAMEQADAIRVQVAIQYRTRSWQTIEVYLGPTTQGQVDLIEPRVQGLAELGVPVTSPVRCMGLADQVAQKLHACTGPMAAGRARDILDILLIEALGEFSYPETANATIRLGSFSSGSIRNNAHHLGLFRIYKRFCL